MPAVLLAIFLAQEFDVVFRQGTIVDGSGNPSFTGDVAVKGERIAALGRVTGKGKREIDARSLVIAPGFIDMHNHSDDSLLVDGGAESMVRQGVTSMVLGEGNSAAPCKTCPWRDFRGYFAKLAEKGIATNIATYVGSSQVWTHVHGERAGPITDDERGQMADLVRAAMRQGALGVASLLSNPPGAWIDTATLTAMAKAAGESGGIYSTHLRTEGHGVFEAAAEALRIGRDANVPVDLIHLKIAEHKLWGKMPDFIALIEKARRDGQQVTANMYPYRAGQNNLSSIIPPWAHEGGRDTMVQRLNDPALRQRLTSEVLNGIPGSDWYNHYTAVGSWEGMLIVSLSHPAYKKYQGKRMSEVIADLKLPPVEALFQLLTDNKGTAPTIFFHHSEDDMRYALKQPITTIGSDGTAVKTTGPLAQAHVHPRYYGTFPRILGRYVREEKVLTLEEAIRKMTSANAAKIQQWDRGLLRPGMFADITLFNPATVIDHSTWEQPHQYSEGITHVMVNGQFVLDQSNTTVARPGRPLLGPGAAH
jgi:N-acyl-D-amino-acid deacylase